MELALFAVVTLVVLGGALGVVLARNPVHCALFLVATMIGVAVFFLMQDAQLLAAVQIIVYASAVVVLFLFVIMLLGVDREEPMRETLRFQLPLAIGLGVFLLAEVLLLEGRTWATGRRSVVGPLVGPNIESVAEKLFTDFLWPFEVTAILLVIAVVGGVALARRSSHVPTELPPGAGDEVEVK